jgi:hypothetical protein
MDDKERRVLASEILEAAANLLAEGEAFEEIGRANTGEPVPIYIATSTEGFGAFNCQYYALEAVVKLIAECESFYDQSGAPKRHRETSVRFMAEVATKVMLVNTRGAIGKALKETFKDGQIVASGVLARLLIQISQKLDGRPRELDSRELIKGEQRRAGADRRDHLRDLLTRIPGSLTQKRTGPEYTFTDAEVKSALRQMNKFSIKALSEILRPQQSDARSTVRDWMNRRKITRKQLEDHWREAHKNERN